MRSDYDMLLRNTYFLPWGKLGDHATLIRSHTGSSGQRLSRRSRLD